MDVSALASKLNNLETSWGSLDAWLKFWIVLVVIGVSVELLVVVIEYRRDLREHRRGTIHSPEKPSTLFVILGLLGAGLVAIGVAGEFSVHVKAGKIESDMRDTTLALIAAVNNEANSAGEHTAVLEGEAASLRRQAAKLTRENLATESHLTEANQEIENERRKRVELAASLLPRDFFDQSGAISKLAPFPPMSAVFEFIDEHEPTAMAEQINFVLETLHWSTSRKLVNQIFIRDGISISVGVDLEHFLSPRTSPENFLRLFEMYSQKRSIGETTARASREGIRKCGIDAEIGNGVFGLPPTTLLIEVGPKPNHALEATLKELGPHPNPTPFGFGMMGGNRSRIREQNADPGKNRPQ